MADYTENTIEHSIPKTILVISATDSGGCAGMQADLRVCNSLRIFAVCAVTAVTAQNSLGVLDAMPVPSTLINTQIQAACGQQRPLAVKIGMLPSYEVADTVAEAIRAQGLENVILDTVAAATAGSVLECGNEKWRLAILRHLLPQCSLVTPNLPELALLTGSAVDTPSHVSQAARMLIDNYGCRGVLVKGGHGANASQCSDFLFSSDSRSPVVFHSQRVETCNLRGTGCSLSTAIACYMARGLDMKEALIKANTYITEAIRGATDVKYDAGAGPIDHFVHNH